MPEQELYNQLSPVAQLQPSTPKQAQNHALAMPDILQEPEQRGTPDAREAKIQSPKYNASQAPLKAITWIPHDDQHQQQMCQFQPDLPQQSFDIAQESEGRQIQQMETESRLLAHLNGAETPNFGLCERVESQLQRNQNSVLQVEQVNDAPLENKNEHQKQGLQLALDVEDSSGQSPFQFQFAADFSFNSPPQPQVIVAEEQESTPLRPKQPSSPRIDLLEEGEIPSGFDIEERSNQQLLPSIVRSPVAQTLANAQISQIEATPQDGECGEREDKISLFDNSPPLIKQKVLPQLLNLHETILNESIIFAPSVQSHEVFPKDPTHRTFAPSVKQKVNQNEQNLTAENRREETQEMRRNQDTQPLPEVAQTEAPKGQQIIENTNKTVGGFKNSQLPEGPQAIVTAHLQVEKAPQRSPQAQKIQPAHENVGLPSKHEASIGAAAQVSRMEEEQAAIVETENPGQELQKRPPLQKINGENVELTDISEIRKVLLLSLPSELSEAIQMLGDEQLLQMYMEIRAEEARTSSICASDQKSRPAQECMAPMISQAVPQESDGAGTVRREDQGSKSEFESQKETKKWRPQRRIVTTVIQQIEYFEEWESGPSSSKIRVLEGGEGKRLKGSSKMEKMTNKVLKISEAVKNLQLEELNSQEQCGE